MFLRLIVFLLKSSFLDCIILGNFVWVMTDQARDSIREEKKIERRAG